MDSYDAEYWFITAAVMAFVGFALFYKSEWLWGLLLLAFAAGATALGVRAHRRGY